MNGFDSLLARLLNGRAARGEPVFDHLAVPTHESTEAHRRRHSANVGESVNMACGAVEQLSDLLHVE
jgi:hypothetical protein